MNVLVWILDKIFDEIDRNTKRRGEVRLQLRHHSLTNEIKISGGRPRDLPKSPDISHVVPVDRCAGAIMRLCGKRWPSRRLQ